MEIEVTKLLAQLNGLLASGVSLAQTQVPILLQQILVYHFTVNCIYLVILLVLSVVFAYLTYLTLENSGEAGLFILPGTLSLTLAIFAFCGPFPVLLQIKLAPIYYLITVVKTLL